MKKKIALSVLCLVGFFVFFNVAKLFFSDLSRFTDFLFVAFFGVAAFIAGVSAVVLFVTGIKIGIEERQDKKRIKPVVAPTKAQPSYSTQSRPAVAPSIPRETKSTTTAKQKVDHESATIPRFEIRRDGLKTKIQPVSFLQEISYSGVTARSSLSTFKKFVVLDTETTGLSITKNDVVEVAAIRVENLKAVSIFHTLIKPPKGITEEAKKINGITAAMVQNAPFLYEVLPSLQEFISGYDLLGHNLEFDLKFLCRAGLDVLSEKRKFFDTKQIAQKLLKKPRSKWDSELGGYETNYDGDWDVYDYKLETLCAHYYIDRSNAHRALGDCFDTVEVFKSLLSEKIDIEE